ncbi:MAG: tRNA lysidine(34) synthetase TilS, partial [Oscillospiraceae bacterium]|nr:tRNA lysidine(34) synthetase TilS [Oscillospiraceae bacterium]
NRGSVAVTESPLVEDACDYELPAAVGETRLRGGYVVFLRRCDIMDGVETGQCGCMGSSDLIDCEKISGDLVFRNKRAGDVFCSGRRNQTKSVKKLFNERGIPVDKRSLVPMLADSCGILWIAGEGISKRVQPHSLTKSFLAISYQTE